MSSTCSRSWSGRWAAVLVATAVLTACAGGQGSQGEPPAASPAPTNEASSPADDGQPADADQSAAETEPAESQVKACDLVSLAMVETAVRSHIEADDGELVISGGAEADTLCGFNVDANAGEGSGYVWSDAGITGFTIDVRTGPSALHLGENAPTGTAVAIGAAGEATWTVCPAGTCGDNMFDEAILLLRRDDAAAAVVFTPFGDEDEVQAVAVDIAEAAWSDQGSATSSD